MSTLVSPRATRLLIVGYLCGAFLACSDPAEPAPGGGSGNAGSGGSAGSAGSTAGGSGGSGASAGSSTTAGSGGSAGSAAGTGGSDGSAAGTGGSGGSGGSAGSAGSGGSGGTEPQLPTAVATIAGLAGMTVTGTATFTQGADVTTLDVNLDACPDGDLVSHLHQNPDCGDNGNAAGGHWVPNGEMLGTYTCSGGVATLNVMKPTTQWTVGGDESTDVTQFSFMVHEGTEQSPGDRIGCGVIMAQ